MRQAYAGLLRVRDLAKNYRLPRTRLFHPAPVVEAVRGVSFDMHAGASLGLVGESGSGKSTVAKILLGLLAPSAGTALLDGKPIAQLARRDIARRVQPIFQDPYASLNPARTIEAIVGLALEIHGIGASRAARRERVAQMLDLVGLSPRLARAYPAELSGGQRQRVAIARALVLEPAILICDEPTSALDVSVQAQILNLLLDLRARLGIAMLLISHNLAVVEHLASRVAVMYLGRIVEIAPAVALFHAPRHPYTRALLASVLTPEPDAVRIAVPLRAGPADPLNVPSGCSFHPRCPGAQPLCARERPGLDGGSVACHFPLA